MNGEVKTQELWEAVEALWLQLVNRKYYSCVITQPGKKTELENMHSIIQDINYKQENNTASSF